MRVWSLKEAKAKWTALLKAAKEAPQVISRHGVEEVVVLSLEQYLELTGDKEDIVSFFRLSPLAGLDLEFTRDKSLPREFKENKPIDYSDIPETNEDFWSTAKSHPPKKSDR